MINSRICIILSIRHHSVHNWMNDDVHSSLFFARKWMMMCILCRSWHENEWWCAFFVILCTKMNDDVHSLSFFARTSMWMELNIPSLFEGNSWRDYNIPIIWSFLVIPQRIVDSWIACMCSNDVIQNLRLPRVGTVTSFSIIFDFRVNVLLFETVWKYNLFPIKCFRFEA